MTDWHPYSHGAQRKAIPFIAAASVVVAYVLGGIVSSLNWSSPWWLDTPAVMGCYGMIYWLFDRKLWRMKCLRWMHGLPDFTGVYDVTARSSHDNFEVTHQGKACIAQSWSHLVVRLDMPSSASISKGAWLDEAPGVGFNLHYSYMNTPKAPADPALSSHVGTAEVTFDAQLKGMGSYYSGRGRTTVGELTFSLRGQATTTR